MGRERTTRILFLNLLTGILCFRFRFLKYSLSVVLPHLTPLRHECILSAFGKKTYGIMKHEHAQPHG